MSAASSGEPGSASPEDWRVAEWLEGLEMGQYAAAFAKNGVTWAALPLLSADDLRECGVAALGHRRVIFSEIQKLSTRTAPQPPPAAPKPQSALAPAPPAPAPPAPAPAVPAPRETAAAPVQGPAPRPPKRGLWAKILASKFLVVSIAVHLLFGLGATLYVVQRYQANRKLTFKGGAPTTSPSKRAMEHKVSMAKKKNSMSAPAQAKRITTAGLAKIVLPDMPSMPTANSVTANKMGGMGGVGVGIGPAGGMGGGGMGSGGGGGMTMFGFHNSSGGGLAGQFYDLKQTKDRQPTGVDIGRYGQIVGDFIKNGWPDGQLNEFYKAPKVLYAAQFLIPDIDAKLAPKAFDVEREVKPERWVALYKGNVVAPESGTYHFVGGGDDILFVKFNGKTVLNASWALPGQLGGDAEDARFGMRTEARYDYGWPEKGPQPGGFAKGAGFQVESGQSYPIEILIGEWPGGRSHFVLLIEKDGAPYGKEKHGHPILPVFRLADVSSPSGHSLPPHRTDGPVWRAKSAGTGSVLDVLKH